MLAEIPQSVAPFIRCRVCGCPATALYAQPCTRCFAAMERERQHQRNLEWRAELQDARAERRWHDSAERADYLAGLDAEALGWDS